MDQLYPCGSATVPHRSPQNWSPIGIFTCAPAATARLKSESQSSTGRSNCAGCVCNRELERPAIGQLESQLRSPLMQFGQLDRILRRNVTLDVERSRHRLVFCRRELLVHSKVVTDPAET